MGVRSWVSVRGEDYIAVLDSQTFAEKSRITVPNGPGMVIFAPDGKQVWLTLKDVGRTMVFDAAAPFAVLKVLDTGPITNHVNIVRNAKGQFAYVTLGGLNQVKVFRTDDFTQVATIDVGALPHGIWPSGDGSRVYVGLENADAVAAIDTATNQVIATVPIGQAPQGVAYVPGAVPAGDGMQNLQPLGVAANKAQLTLGTDAMPTATQVTLFDQVLQAGVTGLAPKAAYLLALAEHTDGTGTLQPLAAFNTNPAGAAIVNAIGPIRQVVDASAGSQRRFLIIAEGTAAAVGRPVQTQR